MSIKSSYISDVYSVYTLNPQISISQDLSSVLSHLCFVANSREGKVTKTVLDREFILAWLKNNIDHELLSEKDSIISSIFDYDKQTEDYILKKEYMKKVSLLKDAVVDAMNTIVKEGSYTILDCYLKVSEKCEEYGTMELGEFKEYISDFLYGRGLSVEAMNERREPSHPASAAGRESGGGTPM